MGFYPKAKYSLTLIGLGLEWNWSGRASSQCGHFDASTLNASSMRQQLIVVLPPIGINESSHLLNGLGLRYCGGALNWLCKNSF